MTYAALAALLLAPAPVPFEAEIDASLAETAAIYPVPKALVVAVISVESGFRPRAVSRAGAKGLMQLMPYTARRVGIAERDLFDPAKNILGGVRLLAVLLRHYDGDVISALVAYNARPRRLFARIPRNDETPAYVWRVLARVRELGRRGRGPLRAGTIPNQNVEPCPSSSTNSTDFVKRLQITSKSCLNVLLKWTRSTALGAPTDAA